MDRDRGIARLNHHQKEVKAERKRERRGKNGEEKREERGFPKAVFVHTQKEK